MKLHTRMTWVLFASVWLGCGRSTLLDSLGASGEGGAATTSSSSVATCIPHEEVCNGLDDDCDGQVDQGDPGGGAFCETGLLGACAAGTLRCMDGALSCMQDREPAAESCNGVDDDCNGEVDDPSPVCALRVFVTSQLYTGDLGGLAGADAKCQALADAASLGGTYKAWLSSSTVDARERLTHSSKPYVLVDGSVVANDWDEFASDQHQRPIDLTETGGATPQMAGIPAVYTGSWSNGTLHTWTKLGFSEVEAICEDWQSTTYYGTAGLIEAVEDGMATEDELWSRGGVAACSTALSLYCLEQ